MSNNIYISIISHSQEDLIINNFKDFPQKLNQFNIKLSILDNTGSKKLQDFCIKQNLFYYHDDIQRGFGANHNLMFEKLQPKDEDIFIICNPDITVASDQLLGLIQNFKDSDADINAPRSYLDGKNKDFLDYPDRYFPYLLNFLVSIVLGKRLHYGSNKMQQNPEWVSGSFIMFKPAVFKALGGFDDGYFMYCEDIDLCFRAKKIGYTIKLDNGYFIEHHSQMDSRKIISKSIIWHIKSAFRFSVKSKRVFGLMVAK